jgi:hypothetical protein
MPASITILAGLTAIANEWWLLAVFWHLHVAVLLLAMVVRRDLSNRLLSALLVLPLVSVSALSWAAGNPFNGAVIAMLALALSTIAHRLSPAPIKIASWPWVVSGATLVGFGWTYPHFLSTAHWPVYLIAAPLGLLPCPTLSMVSGLTLMVSGFRSTAWTLILTSACFAYAMIGVFRLQVTMDVFLLAGAVMLAASRPRRPTDQHDSDHCGELIHGSAKNSRRPSSRPSANRASPAVTLWHTECCDPVERTMRDGERR